MGDFEWVQKKKIKVGVVTLELVLKGVMHDLDFFVIKDPGGGVCGIYFRKGKLTIDNI